MRFPGQWEDQRKEIHDHWARGLSSNSLFLQSDPIGLADGINVFVYAGQNPVRNIDVFGLQVGPDLDDQWNPTFDRNDNPDYREWFEKRFPNTIRGAKTEFVNRIRQRACSFLPSTPPSMIGFNQVLEDDDIDIKPDMARYGDKPQSVYETYVRIGKFQLRTKRVELKWNNGALMCPLPHCFAYSTEMYLLENTGENFLVGFPERSAIYGRWNLSGNKCCDK